MGGIRARSTTFRTNNGETVSVINIGVPSDHPLADGNSMAGPSGLHNVQVGGIQMPAPQFMVVHNQDANGATTNPLSATTQAANPLAGGTGNEQGVQIESLVNNLLRSFMDVFNGREFLRMQMQYNEFNPNNFMNNFN